MKTTLQAWKKGTIMNAGKKLLVVLFSLGLALGASAQRGHIVHGGGHGGVVYVHPRTYVGVGVGLGYGFGYPFYSPFYNPWYGPFPPYYYGYGMMPSRLSLQIENIKNDYSLQIKDVRHDKTIPRKERKERINQLKHDRDAAIIQARKDYYYNSRRNYDQPKNGQQPGNGKNEQPNNGSSLNGEQPEYSEKPANSGS